MRVLTVIVLILGLSCQIAYSTEDDFINAKELNIVTGAKYYKNVKKLEITSKGKSSDGTIVTITETINNIGERSIEGKIHLVSKSESTILIGVLKPTTITQNSYYDLNGNFEFSYLNDINMKRVPYDKSNIDETMQVGKKYFSSNKNSDGSIEMTETIATRVKSNIIIKSKSYVIKNDSKTISSEIDYILQKDDVVKQINYKFMYPNGTLELSSVTISIVTQNQ